MRDGKRVRRAEAGGTASEEPEEEPKEPDEDEEEDEEARLARTEHAKQRPSYIAWHSAPKAQRFGPFRCEQRVRCFLGCAYRFLLCSTSEKAALDEAIAVYAEEQALDPTSLEWLYHTRVGKRQRAAWLALAEALPHRSPRQVWGHATRRLHAARGAGPWGDEETAALKRLVARHGRNWVAIGAELDRKPDACRDRWRKVDKPYSSGAWSQAECDALKEAVAEQLAQQQQQQPGPSTGVAFVTRDNLSWSAVAAEVGTRNAKQASEKWCALAGFRRRGFLLC